MTRRVTADPTHCRCVVKMAVVRHGCFLGCYPGELATALTREDCDVTAREISKQAPGQIFGSFEPARDGRALASRTWFKAGKQI